MEMPEVVPIDILRDLVCSLVSGCTDEGLLDLIYRLLMQSGAQ